ncbi:hypothetical protein SAMN05428939_7815 [Streptomyces sp. TLI_105]|nr:hypothetical protein SAMN05428939_7815 [Streptomyces sp. TLI_105]
MLDWWTWEAPLTVVTAAFTGLAAWAIPASLLPRTTPQALQRFIPGVTLVGALATLTLLDFAWLGTPLGVGNDTNGTCASDNIPVWWPHWLPA